MMFDADAEGHGSSEDEDLLVVSESSGGGAGGGFDSVAGVAGGSGGAGPAELVQVSQVLLAEFDIDKGSSITCCKTWNGSGVEDFTEKTLKGASLDDFAEIMLPDGTHRRQGDLSVAVLNRGRPLSRSLFCAMSAANHHLHRSAASEFQIDPSSSKVRADILDWDNNGDDRWGAWQMRKRDVECQVLNGEEAGQSASSGALVVCDWDGEGAVPQRKDLRITVAGDTCVHALTPTFLALECAKTKSTAAIRGSRQGSWVGLSFARPADLQRFKYRLFKSLRQNVEDVPQASQEFFFSIAVNRLDANVRRGACIKAIGIVTTHRFFRAFEPLMQSALDECFQELLLPSATPSPSKHQAESNADAEGAEHKEEESYPTSSEERKRALASNEEAVARLLRKLNSTTIAADGTGDGASDAEGAPTSVPVLYPREVRRMLRRKALITALHERGGGGTDQATSPAAQLHKRLPPTATLWFKDEVAVKSSTKATISLTLDPEEVDGASLSGLVQQFGTGVAAIWRAALEERRILFVGENAAAGTLVDAVLSTCVLTRPLQNQLCRAFPYVNLQHLDELLTTPGFVAGTSNPIFKTHPQWWDILCDLNTGEIFYSSYSTPLLESAASSATNANSGGNTKTPHSSPSSDGKPALGYEPVPHRYIDSCLGDALVSGEADGLGEEWLRACCDAVTTSVLEAAIANRVALLEANRRFSSASKSSGPGEVAEVTSSTPSSSSLPSTPRRLQLWGSFGVQLPTWNSRPQAAAKTTAQLLPRVVASSPFQEYRMAEAARDYHELRWQGREFDACLPPPDKDDLVPESSNQGSAALSTSTSDSEEDTHSFRGLVRQLQTLKNDPFGLKFGLTIAALQKVLHKRGNSGGAYLQLVALLDGDAGGLHPLAIGLLHPSAEIKNVCLDILKHVHNVPAAQHSIEELNPYFRNIIAEFSKPGFQPEATP